MLFGSGRLRDAAAVAVGGVRGGAGGRTGAGSVGEGILGSGRRDMGGIGGLRVVCGWLGALGWGADCVRGFGGFVSRRFFVVAPGW